LEKEFRLHPVRKWRADFAHLESNTLIEIEGGIDMNGRHNRGAEFAADLERYDHGTYDHGTGLLSRAGISGPGDVFLHDKLP